MTKSISFRVLAALMLLLALAGCGGGGESSAAATGPGEAAAEPTTVTMDDLSYIPADLSVPVGTEVTWINDDAAPHTVTFDDDAVTSSEQLETGDTFTATFDQAGTYSYICAIHPDMKATVTVS